MKVVGVLQKPHTDRQTHTESPTAAICSETAPLFRSALVNMSSGNSRMAAMREKNEICECKHTQT